VSRSCLQLDGVDDFLSLAGTGGAVVSDFFVIASVVHTPTVAQHAWYSNRGVHVPNASETDIYLGANTVSGSTFHAFAYTTAVPAGNNTPTGQPSARAVVQGLRVTGNTTSRLYVGYASNIVAGTPVTHSARMTTNPSVGRIGWDAGAANFYKGKIRALIIGHGSVSDDRWTDLMRWVGSVSGIHVG